MKCTNCGTEIADRALICYRCGTATTEAKYRAAPLRPRRSTSRSLLIALILLLLALAAIYFFRVVG